jgi:hypothetical protein
MKNIIYFIFLAIIYSLAGVGLCINAQQKSTFISSVPSSKPIKGNSANTNNITNKAKATANTTNKMVDKVNTNANTANAMADKANATANTANAMADKANATANKANATANKANAAANKVNMVADKENATVNKTNNANNTANKANTKYERTPTPTTTCESESVGKAVLMIGGGANYLYGTESSANEEYDNTLISWQGNVMIGYQYVAQRGRGSTIGVFGIGGNTPERSMLRILDQAGIVATTLKANEDNNYYYQVEGGVILFNIIRASTGMGFQNYKDNADENQTIMYYSTTVGLHLPLGPVRITLDVNQMYGRDFNKTLYRPVAGLMFQF